MCIRPVFQAVRLRGRLVAFCDFREEMARHQPLRRHEAVIKAGRDINVLTVLLH